MGVFKNGLYQTDAQIDIERQRSEQAWSDAAAMSNHYPRISKFVGIVFGAFVALVMLSKGIGWFWCLLVGLVAGALMGTFFIFLVSLSAFIFVLYILYKIIKSFHGF